MLKIHPLKLDLVSLSETEGFVEFWLLTVSRECMFLGSLSRHNKDLEQRTLKSSVHHSSRVLGTNHVTALRQISVTAPFYLEDSRREREWERVRERERKKRARACGRERVQEKALWLLLLYVFSSTWACPMQIGLSQECCLFCLFCLKSSLCSSDLPLTFLVF